MSRDSKGARAAGAGTAAVCSANKGSGEDRSFPRE